MRARTRFNCLRLTSDSKRRTPRADRCVISMCSGRSEEHTSELQSQSNLVCRLLLEKKKTNTPPISTPLTDTTSPCNYRPTSPSSLHVEYEREPRYYARNTFPINTRLIPRWLWSYI